MLPLLLALFLPLLTACGAEEAKRDLSAIHANDTLRVGTRYNSTSYFLYRGAAMGYEYELLCAFAEAQGVALEMVTAGTHDELLEMLRSGAVDVLAARLVPEAGWRRRQAGGGGGNHGAAAPGAARAGPDDPEQDVAGGVLYLGWLEEQWLRDVADPAERLRFVLASYNVGRGHVQDAQRLATKHGHDARRWEDVSCRLLQKSRRDIFSDPVVRYG